MKKRRYRKTVAGISAFVMGAAAVIPSAVPVMADREADMRGNITVDPDTHYQTLEGWGTSLCWWGNTIGSWGDADWNGDGRPDREEIAELAFSPEYLNLNVVRYNVGGGDKEDSSIKRCEGLVPGWTEDMTGTADGTAPFQAEEFYAKSTEEMKDAGQLWMLEQANAYRKAYSEETGQENDVINKVFSNSPPYYMTKSGTSTGGTGWDPNNLKDDCYDDFAMYLARATEWVDKNLESKYGAGVSYVEPLNEPDTSYWYEGSTKQEGCIFNTGELQSKAYREMQYALNADEFQGSLDDVRITGTDETSLWNAINSFNRLDDDVKSNLETISAHTYSGSDSERRELRSIARKYDKGLWMSEVTKGGGSHYDGCHESMEAGNTRSQSEGIMADLKELQSSAWIAWLVADSEYECLQTNSNWGLLHAVFEKDGQPVPDYHTNLVDGNGSRLDWVPGEGYWAVTKQFYTMMQYSKYLKAGYTMIEIDDSNMCAAISPQGDELVIVAQNFGDDRNDTIDLGAFPGAEEAELYRTSDSESCELAEVQDVTDGVLDVTLPWNSVSTYVIKAADGSSICNPENYAEIVEADVEMPGESWVSDIDKFSYEDSWGESSEDFGGGKYSTAENASATLTFEGTQALVYGSKAPEGAVVNISVDGGDAEQVSLAADNKDGGSLLYNTGELSQGSHTVTITKAEGQGDRLLELNYAKVVRGTLDERIEKIEESGDLYTVSGITPALPTKVYALTNMGNRIEKDVVWDLEGIDFTENTTLKGSVEGASVKAAANVKIVPENVQYFIDCNSPKSPEYYRVDGYADLLNETPDQKYAEGSWGFIEDYNAYDGDINDNYDTGWYAGQGQEISYTVPLEKSTYRLNLGFKEWWNQDRPMKVSLNTGGETIELGKTNTWNSGNPWNEETYEFTCDRAGNATITIAADGGPDPVLSYIRIQNILELQALKDAVNQAEEIDRDPYQNEKLAVLDEAAAAGRSLLFRADAAQNDIDLAAEKIRLVIEDLNGGVQTEADMTSLNLAILMAEKMEAQQAENNCYTADSWKTAAEALAEARTVKENPEASQNAVDEVFLKLLTACNLLEDGVQKTGLKAAMEGADTILGDEVVLEQYTSDSVEAVRAALKKAQQVYGSEAADQETVNQAARELMDAVTRLLAREEATRLDILIQKAEGLLEREEQYTPSSILKLKEALEAAKAASGSSQADEGGLWQAYDLLAEAMTSLVRKADKAELKNALDKAEEILSEAEKYLESSIAGLQRLTDETKVVYDDAEADKERVGNALKRLIDEILKARLMGDVDLNGAVDTEDTAAVLKYNAELAEFTGEQQQAADVDRNGIADSSDAAVILQFAAEKIKSF